MSTFELMKEKVVLWVKSLNRFHCLVIGFCVGMVIVGALK